MTTIFNQRAAATRWAVNLESERTLRAETESVPVTLPVSPESAPVTTLDLDSQ